MNYFRWHITNTNCYSVLEFDIKSHEGVINLSTQRQVHAVDFLHLWSEFLRAHVMTEAERAVGLIANEGIELLTYGTPNGTTLRGLDNCTPR